MSFNNALIIAGGFGKRMLPLTNYVPKPLIQIENKPLIQYAIDFLKNGGVKSISATYGHKAPMLTEYLNGRVSTLINTMHEDNAFFLFKTIIKHINEPIIICPCDLILDVDLKALHEEYMKMNEPALCIVPIPANDNADFIHKDSDSKVLKITRLEKSNMCASGVQIVNPALVNKLIEPCENFYDVWTNLIAKDSLYVTQTQPTTWKAFDNLNDII